MASGKVARRTAVADVAEVLDSPEVAALVRELDALRWTGVQLHADLTMLARLAQALSRGRGVEEKLAA